MTGKDGGWTDADEEVMRYERECAPSPAVELVRELRDACAAMLVMMDRGVRPRKLDEAATWRENDERARAMGLNAVARADKALADAEPQKKGESK